jgi:glycosyltransferase involved in cell wall biosynthesis
MARIAVNTRLLQSGRLEGIGRFSSEILMRLVKANPQHEFYFLFDRDFSPEFLFAENVTPLILAPKARHPFLFYYWFEHVVPPVLKRLKIDLFFSPDGFLSLGTSTPSITVIHDINFHFYPQDLPWLVAKYYNYYFPKFANKASAVITVSTFSKKEIARAYGISEQRISVAGNACSEGFEVMPVEVQASVREKFSGGHNYFLYTGSVQPRKNLSNLIKAFQQFRNRNQQFADYHLVLAGSVYFENAEMKAVFNDVQLMKNVIRLGRVHQEELHRLMAAAFALVYVPVYEGFGIPLLEAMKCGVPVITSNTSSLPEVAGDAALFADPSSVNSIAEAMMKLAGDETLRKGLILKGNERNRLYSWDKAAAVVSDLINETLAKTTVHA